MSTRTAVFAAGDDWVCPAGVSAVFLAMVPGGAGSFGAGDTFSFHGSAGGGGSGEMMMGRPISVTPGDTYTVTVGIQGGGLTYAGSFAGGLTYPTSSSFSGLHVLPGNYAPGNGPGNSGGGGGVGGSTGGSGGGGFDRRGRREACHFTGGAGGGFGSFYDGLHSPSGGVLGGALGFTGIDTGVGGDFGHGAGGAGGGTIFGGNTGGNSRTTPPDGTSTNYGSGAGGAGEPQSGTVNGGNGSPGYVVLMYAKP